MIKFKLQHRYIPVIWKGKFCFRKHVVGAAARLYSSLTWGLKGSGKFNVPAPLFPGKGPRYPLNRKPGVSETWSGRSKEQIKILPPAWNQSLNYYPSRSLVKFRTSYVLMIPLVYSMKVVRHVTIILSHENRNVKPGPIEHEARIPVTQ